MSLQIAQQGVGIMSSSSSYMGAQPKWVSNGIWYKRDLIGGEAVAETLVSLFLSSCLNTSEFEAGFVPYKISPKDGRVCCSPSFLREGETFVPLHTVMTSFKTKWAKHSDFEGKFNYIDSVYREVLGYSCKHWLFRVLTLDVMFRNTDRHLSNLGFIADRQGNLRPAPIFDNGLAIGVSEGTYYDLSNTITGLGFKIKPYELTVGYLNKYINPSYFAFSVVQFIERFKRENIPKNKVSLAFLNILVKYYPKDSLGLDTKYVLEKHLGSFGTKRFL